MNKSELYVVSGVSGRTGSATAQALLNAGKRVRVLVRDAAKGAVWASRGAEVATADFADTLGLSRALSGADGAYIISPQQYASNDLFAQAELIARAFADAATTVQLPKLVALSSIGADKTSGTGWISMNRMLEQHLSQTGLPVAFLRAAYFMENWTALIKVANEAGNLPSFLSPTERKIPMVATSDVGHTAAEVLCENWNKSRIIELEGPTPYSPNEVAQILTQTLGKHVNAIAIPESDWAGALSGAGLSAAALEGFIEMTQGLNTDHIKFLADINIEHRKGVVPLDAVVNTMVKSTISG